MKFRNPEFAVGLFALAGLAIIIFMSTQVNRQRGLGANNQHYFADFETVTGLIPKLPVEVSGIISGYVDTIDLVNNKARVVIQMDKRVKVYQDAALYIKDRGVLGDRYVVLFPGDPGKPMLEDGGQILYTQSQSDFEKLSSTLAETAQILKELVSSDNPQGALGHTIVNLRDMTDKLNQMVDENRMNISAITENVRELTSRLNAMTAENRDDIRNLISQLNTTVENIKSITDKIDNGEGSLGQLINDDTTITKLNDTLDDVHQTVGMFNRVQLKFRYRGEYLMSANELQNLFGIIIAPGPDKYLLLELVGSPHGETTVTDTIITSGGTATATRTVQTKTGLTFTLMFAKRFWDATLRVGLIRSQGGVGLDYHFFKDHLVLTGEMFDLNRPDNKPVFRLYATLFAYRHFIITGGVDDLMNEIGGINPFVGVGLQFTDNDFKALLPVVSSGAKM